MQLHKESRIGQKQEDEEERSKQVKKSSSI